MRIRPPRRRRVVWLLPLALLAAGSAYLASNNVPASSAGDNSVAANIPAQVYTYDDASPTITYSGSWSHTPPSALTTGDYNGTISSSQQTGARASITFTTPTAAAIQLIGEQGPTSGSAVVYRTGVEVATVNEYSPTVQKDAVVLTTPILSGSHTYMITVKSATFYLDAINVP